MQSLRITEAEVTEIGSMAFWFVYRAFPDYKAQSCIPKAELNDMGVMKKFLEIAFVWFASSAICSFLGYPKLNLPLYDCKPELQKLEEKRPCAS